MYKYKYKFILISVFCLVIFNVSVYAQNSENKVTIEPGSISQNKESKFLVPIQLNGNKTGISTIGLEVIYDNKYLQPVSVKEGILGSKMYFNIEYKENAIKIGSAAVENKSGDGNLFYVEFKAKPEIKKDIKTNISIKIDEIKYTKENDLIDLDYKLNTGNITILSSDINYGDYNNDGYVTADDAARVLNYVLNKDESITKEELKKIMVSDGETVTAKDAIEILNKSLNSDYVFPILEDN